MRSLCKDIHPIHIHLVYEVKDSPKPTAQDRTRTEHLVVRSPCVKDRPGS